MEYLEVLELVKENPGMTSQHYAILEDITPNHASKDLSKGYKMGFCDREKVGRFYAYTINGKGMARLLKNMNEKKKQVEEKQEREDLEEETDYLKERVKDLKRTLCFCMYCVLKSKATDLDDLKQHIKNYWEWELIKEGWG